MYVQANYYSVNKTNIGLHDLKLKDIFSFMFQNMAFQAEQKIKSQILNTLGTDQIFRLLSDPEVNVLMKTLGLLRNLLSTKPHIDHIMGLHGNQIMQVIIFIYFSHITKFRVICYTKDVVMLQNKNRANYYFKQLRK